MSLETETPEGRSLRRRLSKLCRTAPNLAFKECSLLAVANLLCILIMYGSWALHVTQGLRALWSRMVAYCVRVGKRSLLGSDGSE